MLSLDVVGSLGLQDVLVLLFLPILSFSYSDFLNICKYIFLPLNVLLIHAASVLSYRFLPTTYVPETTCVALQSLSLAVGPVSWGSWPAYCKLRVCGSPIKSAYFPSRQCHRCRVSFIIQASSRSHANKRLVEWTYCQCQGLPTRLVSDTHPSRYISHGSTRGTDLPSHLPCEPDLVLAADCVYFEPAFDLLVSTLSSLATSPKTEFLFCYKKRRKVGNFEVLP